jgi:peptide/nickel transport system ATP-binding protein
MVDNILEVRNLTKYFKTKKGLLHAVDNISFTLERGKTLGIVGESGCGKSTIGRSILRLIEPTSGEIIFNGEDLMKLNTLQMRSMRTKMQIIFQDPYSSLNPRRTVSQTISEAIELNHLIHDKKDIEKRVSELMDMVGLADRFAN